jgi:2-polyprenyl-3-methyl-5-hydroxy-6-metoxy-1,4-benzoquinol methylase
MKTGDRTAGAQRRTWRIFTRAKSKPDPFPAILSGMQHAYTVRRSQRLLKPAMLAIRCRFCGHPTEHVFVDLGMLPLCQTNIAPEQLNTMEPFYPLRAYVCDECLLVQVKELMAPTDIFSEYSYFSSYSDSWVEHSRRYCDLVCRRFNLLRGASVMEIASNDGYLLKHFMARGNPVLGVEPAANVASVARANGVPTLTLFFGRQVAEEVRREHGAADLIVANNVLDHVPDINDFVSGMRVLLKKDGLITIEIPHLMQLMELNQFDTIYHEHYCYLSFTTTVKILAKHSLVVFDVEQLPTHGGSLRIYARHAEDGTKVVGERVSQLLELEASRGYTRIDAYLSFEDRVRRTKRALLEFLIAAKERGRKIVGYGAPGKGNTLLNYCGMRSDFIDFTVDRNPHKQGRLTPGTHIPILAPERLFEARPDYVLILPWNIKEEVMQSLARIRSWGGKFVVPIPSVQVLD